jgi:hypothetical protein
MTRLPANWRLNTQIQGHLDREGRWAVIYTMSHGRTTWVCVVDTQHNRVVVECPLSQTQAHGQTCWHPDFTRTALKYQEQGLALRLYVFLLKRGVILRSGRTQSTGSQRLWGKLCDVPGVNVYSVPRDGTWYLCERGNDGAPDPGDHDPYSDYKTVCFAVWEGK